jgi:hypothetical protein
MASIVLQNGVGGSTTIQEDAVTVTNNVLTLPTVSGSLYVGPSGGGPLPIISGGTGATTAAAAQTALGVPAANGTGASGTWAINITGNAATVTNAFPTGTRLLFQQSTAPTGWTQDTTYNNYALRVVSGAVSSGGSVPFTTAFASQTPSGSVGVGGTVGDTTLTTAHIATHAHTQSVDASYNPVAGGPAGLYAQNNTGANPGVSALNTLNNGSSSSHNHSFSGSGSFSGNAINLTVQYVDAIICTKN